MNIKIGESYIDSDKLTELTVTSIDVVVDSTSVKCVISVQDDFGTSEYQVGVDDHIIRRWKSKAEVSAAANMMERINSAEVGDRVDVSETKYYSVLDFWYDKELGYSWCAGSKTSSRSIRPMASQYNIKFFKTLAGAKKNFIKRISEQGG